MKSFTVILTAEDPMPPKTWLKRMQALGPLVGALAVLDLAEALNALQESPAPALTLAIAEARRHVRTLPWTRNTETAPHRLEPLAKLTTDLATATLAPPPAWETEFRDEFVAEGLNALVASINQLFVPNSDGVESDAWLDMLADYGPALRRRNQQVSEWIQRWWDTLPMRYPFDLLEITELETPETTGSRRLAHVGGTHPTASILAYRGVQNPGQKGVQAIPSFTPSLPVAVIWSSVPGNREWRREFRTLPRFTPTSTVLEVRLALTNPLDLGGPTTSMGDVLRALRYGEPGGIGPDEAERIFNYLINRAHGRIRGVGAFQYRCLDENGEPLDLDVASAMLYGRTPLDDVREEFVALDDAEGLQCADRLEADTFVFADAPAVQREALRQGFDTLAYIDVFQAAEEAAEVLLKRPLPQIPGVVMKWSSIDKEAVPTHLTYRPLVPGHVEEIRQIPAEEARLLMDLPNADRSAVGVQASTAGAKRLHRSEGLKLFREIRQALVPRVQHTADWLPIPKNSAAGAPQSLAELAAIAQGIPPNLRERAIRSAILRVRIHLPAILEARGLSAIEFSVCRHFDAWSTPDHLEDVIPDVIPRNWLVLGYMPVPPWWSGRDWGRTMTKLALGTLLSTAARNSIRRWEAVVTAAMLQAEILAAWRLGILTSDQPYPRLEMLSNYLISAAIKREIKEWWGTVSMLVDPVWIR